MNQMPPLGKERKIINDLLKVEEYTSKLRSHVLQINNRLPNLQLPSVNSHELEVDDIKDEFKSMLSPTSKIVRQMIDSSELVSSSLMSSAASSSNADLSEDEQINYYNDEDANLNIDEYSLRDISSSVHLTGNNRSLSTSSDQTLIVMNPSDAISSANKPRIVEIVDSNDISSENPSFNNKESRYAKIIISWLSIFIIVYLFISNFNLK